jgi:hypothetical protein
MRCVCGARNVFADSARLSPCGVARGGAQACAELIVAAATRLDRRPWQRFASLPAVKTMRLCG